MFISDDKPLPAFVDSNDSFIVSELPWITEKPSNDYLYQQIVYKVIRQPNKLLFHIQRIYFAYGLNMTDQLYAALVDLLAVLKGRGVALSRRMISATQSLLAEEQVKTLEQYIHKQNNSLFIGNKFSVCTVGIINTQTLLIKDSDSAEKDYDPLEIARDYIEYSQLGSALETLELAILKTPERQDLQFELLDLLKQTHNIQDFTRIRKRLNEKQQFELSEWQQLADYFAGTSNEK